MVLGYKFRIVAIVVAYTDEMFLDTQGRNRLEEFQSSKYQSERGPLVSPIQCYLGETRERRR